MPAIVQGLRGGVEFHGAVIVGQRQVEAPQVGLGQAALEIGRGVARLGGITGAKQTAMQIPLCHPVRITAVDIEFEIDRALPGVIVEATVEAVDRTGPEMEAMMAASTAALTIYDMCKAIDREMAIVELVLLEKRGGKSGRWVRSG